MLSAAAFRLLLAGDNEPLLSGVAKTRSSGSADIAWLSAAPYKNAGSSMIDMRLLVVLR